jgi:hypothetical protein
MAEAMERAQVLDFELQKQLVPLMKDMVPLPGIYDPAFIAANQAERADNIIKGTKREQVGAARRCAWEGYTDEQHGGTAPGFEQTRKPQLGCAVLEPVSRLLLLHPFGRHSTALPPPPPPDGDRAPAHPPVQG